MLVAPAVSGTPDDPEGLDIPVEPLIRARLEALDAAEARGDLAAVNELEARLWLDGPAQPAGRVGAALRELFLDMNGIALAAPDPGSAAEPASAWARLEAIAVPVLLVWGTLEFAPLQARMRVLERRIAGAQTFVMPGAAHLPSLEQPAPFNAALTAFLATLQRAAR